jgi:hypothetical protein
MSTGKTIFTILASVAVLGILFATDKGSATRRKILRKSEDLSKALGDKIDERFDKLVSTVSGKVKSKATQDNQFYED